MTARARKTKAKAAEPFEPGLVPAPGELLVWKHHEHFDRWRDLACVLCKKPTPMRSHGGEPVHKTCAEGWIAAHPVKAREGRFASDARRKTGKSYDDHA
ncbi:hypothetical protein ACFYXC_36440 [Streptomyces sp. NPDC002701]|uniref:hypothetical protein n=1 Tax=Streptomyces sp. NPDC002701 TaxID=3364661 RepID=UPI0036C689BD